MNRHQQTCDPQRWTVHSKFVKHLMVNIIRATCITFIEEERKRFFTLIMTEIIQMTSNIYEENSHGLGSGLLIILY